MTVNERAREAHSHMYYKFEVGGLDGEWDDGAKVPRHACDFLRGF